MIDSPRVCIQVQSIYVESQSIPEEERYVFAYTITIRNLGRNDVQLLGRYWLITNSNGRQTEVQGEGVIGEQPVIPPGGGFSIPAARFWKRRWAPWKAITKWWAHQGQPFRTAIPVFRLAIPTLIH